MSLGQYLVGVCFFAGIWGAAAYSASVLLRRRLARLSGAPAALAWSLLFLCVLLGVHLLPGALGLLSREAALVAAVATALGASRLRPAPAGREPAPYPDPVTRDGMFSITVASIAVAGVAVFVAVDFLRLVTIAPTHIDALSFALPGVADWIRSGSVWDPGAFLPLFQIRTYPNNGELLSVATILPWRSDFLIRVPALGLLTLTGLGVYAVGRELRASAAAAALVAAAVVAMRIVAFPALDQLKPDVFMYATFTAGALFLLRHARTSERADLLLAGAGLGLAFGSRWYGVSTAVVVVGVWVAALLLARRPWKRVAADGALLSGAILVTGGFWLLRNLAETGNPLYPVKFAPFGITILDAPRDILTEKLGYTIVDRLGQWDAWREFIIPDLKAALGLTAALLALGAAAAIPVALAAVKRRAEPVPVIAAVIVAGGLALAYVVTPASAQGGADAPLPGLVSGTVRWLVPALIAGAGPAAWALCRAGRARPVAELVLLAGVADGLQRSFDLPRADVLLGAGVLTLVGACAVAVRRQRRRPPRRLGTAAAVASVTATLVLGGYVVEERYNDKRFEGASPVLGWVLEYAPEGRRIGMAGDWTAGFVPTYGLFGPRSENEVDYAGEVVDGQLRQYHGQDAFVRALRDRGYDILVVGLQPEPDFDDLTLLPNLTWPPEAAWAQRAGFRELLRDDRYILMLSPGEISRTLRASHGGGSTPACC